MSTAIISNLRIVLPALSFSTVPVSQSVSKLCGSNPSIKDLIDYEFFCGSPLGFELNAINEITVSELFTYRENKKKHVLLDVREKEEIAIAKIENSHWIPMNEVPKRLNEIDPSRKIVVYCKSVSYTHLTLPTNREV